MTVHHPSEPTLAAYATGTMPEALALVTATHLSFCPACRISLSTIEAIGGVILDDLTPVPMSPDALDHLLQRLDTPPPPPPPLLHPNLPAPLNRVPLGRWWPISRGVRYRPLQTTGGAWGGLIHAKPGRSLPRHGHQGLELTCIISGAFADAGGQYHAGDLSEPESDHDHPPVVVSAEPCLCVLASEGMHLRGVLGWVQRILAL